MKLLLTHARVITTQGYVPIPTRNVAAKDGRCELLPTRRRRYPRAAIAKTVTRKSPRLLKWSESDLKTSRATAAQTKTGIVSI